MRRFAALLGKELRQHAAAGGALAAVLAAAYLLMLVGTMAAPETVSLMQAHAGFLFFLTLGAMVVGNRLVVAEYHGRTQLFVEALPLRRFEMVALKYFLGLALLALACGASLAASAAMALSREPIDGRFLGLVAVRSACYVFCMWSFFFAMGLIGRLRIPIYAAIVLALAMVDEMTAFEIERFGPLAVFDNNTLVTEREALPVRAVLETIILGVGLTGLAFGLALIQEGSLAETLARRMSQREKATLGILFTAVLFAFAFLDERRDKEPYAFAEDEVLASEALPLEVLYLLPERRTDAAALLARLENDLEALARELGWQELPAVRVAYGPSLDPGIYDRAELAENDGVLVRANFAPAAGWDARGFSAYLVGLVLDEASDGRARFEPKAWLRDGFAQWWSRRPDAGAIAPTAAGGADLASACSDDSAMLRALWATRGEPVTEERMRRWLRTRERLGEAIAEGLAYAGLRVLEHRHGQAAVLDLARRVFGRRPTQDVRELIYEWRHPMAVVFEQATAVPWPGFVADWNAELERLRAAPGCRQRLAGLPEGTGTIAVEDAGATVRDVVFGFEFSRPPPADTLVTLLHSPLTAFDEALERHDLERLEKLWPAAERAVEWRLVGTYSRGSRAFLALEVESDVLGCGLRFHAERRQLR